MGNTSSSIFSAPSILEEQDAQIKELQKMATDLENFVATVKSKPSISQSYYFSSMTDDFKKKYKNLTEKCFVHSDIDALMTQFGRIQLKWNKLLNPESYSYSDAK